MTEVGCPSCRAGNPAAAKFCMSCGSSLAAQPIGLRFVTVAFCDISGSTQLAVALDPEIWHGVLERYFGTVGRALLDAGGRLEKFIGDAVVGVFGADGASEDDATRAAYGALDALGRLNALNADIRAHHGPPLAIRFGIASGRVVIADRDSSFAIGAVMNRAARLQAAAPASGVLVDVRTWLLVRDRLPCTPVAPVTAKGFDKPLHAWHVRAGTVPPPAPWTFVNQTDLMGRLRHAVRAHLAVPGVRTILLSGEPGSGKTRVLDQLRAELADQPVRVLGIGGQRGDTDQARLLLGRILRDLDAPGAGSRVAPSLAELRWAVQRCIGAVSRERTLVIVVDDADHLPDAVRAALHGPPGGGSVVLIMAGRTELADAHGVDAIRLRVGPLPEPEARQLLDAMVGDVELHSLDISPDQIVRRSHGNPLFIAQLFALAHDGIADEVPPSAEAALGARIERLGTAARHVLGCLGAWRGDAGQRDLEAVCQLDEDEFGQALAELDHAGLATSVAAAEVAYTHMMLAERAGAHLRIADRLRAVAAGRPGVMDFAAAHAWQGCQLMSQTAPDSPEADAARGLAAQCLVAAARHAIARSEVKQAADLCRQARDLAPADPPLLLEAAALESYALGAAGQVAEALERIAAVAELDGNPSARVHLNINEATLVGRPPEPAVRDAVVAVGDDCAGARLDIADGVRAAKAGDYRRAERLLRAAHARMRRYGAGLGVAEIYGNLSLFLVYGDSPVTVALAECRALRTEVAGAPVLHAVVSCSTALLLHLAGDTAEARRLLSEATAVFADMGHRRAQAGALEFRGVVAFLAGDPAGGARCMRQAASVYRTAGAHQLAVPCALHAAVWSGGRDDTGTAGADESWETRVLRQLAAAPYEIDRAGGVRRVAAALTEISTITGSGARLLPLTECLRVAEHLGDPATVTAVRRQRDDCLAARSSG